MSEREEATRRLKWSVDRLRFLTSLSDAPRAEVEAAWAEYIEACRRVSRISDGISR